jgi:hypothetical protein
MNTADPTGHTGPHQPSQCDECRRWRSQPGGENSICDAGRIVNLAAEVQRLDAEADQISRFHKLSLDRTGATSIEPVDVIFGRWLDQHQELAGQVGVAESALRALLGNDPEDNMLDIVELVAKAQLDVDCEWERAEAAEQRVRELQQELAAKDACWHCKDAPLPTKPRCDVCPEECDDDACSEEGCREQREQAEGAKVAEGECSHISTDYRGTCFKCGNRNHVVKAMRDAEDKVHELEAQLRARDAELETISSLVKAHGSLVRGVLLNECRASRSSSQLSRQLELTSALALWQRLTDGERDALRSKPSADAPSATLGKDHSYIGPDGAHLVVRGGSLDDFKRACGIKPSADSDGKERELYQRGVNSKISTVEADSGTQSELGAPTVTDDVAPVVEDTGHLFKVGQRVRLTRDSRGKLLGEIKSKGGGGDIHWQFWVQLDVGSVPGSPWCEWFAADELEPADPVPVSGRCCFQGYEVEDCGAPAVIDGFCEPHARVVHGTEAERVVPPPAPHHDLNEYTFCVRCKRFDPAGTCPGAQPQPAPTESPTDLLRRSELVEALTRCGEQSFGVSDARVLARQLADALSKAK